MPGCVAKRARRRDDRLWGKRLHGKLGKAELGGGRCPVLQRDRRSCGHLYGEWIMTLDLRLHLSKETGAGAGLADVPDD